MTRESASDDLRRTVTALLPSVTTGPIAATAWRSAVADGVGRAVPITAQDGLSSRPGRPDGSVERAGRQRPLGHGADRGLVRPSWLTERVEIRSTGCHPDGPTNSSGNAKPPAHLTSVRVCGLSPAMMAHHEGTHVRRPRRAKSRSALVTQRQWHRQLMQNW